MENQSVSSCGIVEFSICARCWLEPMEVLCFNHQEECLWKSERKLKLAVRN